MSWLSVNLSLQSRNVDNFSDMLLKLGAIAIDIDANAASGPTDIRVLFPAAANVAAALHEAARWSGLAFPPDYSVVELAEQDWVRLTQSQFQPIPITPRLYIVPTWSPPPDPSAINVRLDPSLAFGTGSHATTRLCLRWLARVIRGGETVVDYGCGSGILAISALKLGAQRALGIDIEEDALRVSRQNALQNQVEATFCLANECPKVQADLVVANILLQPLIELAPDLAALARGRIALSGIPASEIGELARRYEEWFVIDDQQSENGWSLLTGTRK
jgi:ribosomal protein L11 methyltransferase